jgi:fumarate hydratase class I
MRAQIREAAEATPRQAPPQLGGFITGQNSATTSDRARRSFTSISGPATTSDQLILKGGGCENTNAQYALPVELPHLGRADRTLDGVRKCILHAVWNAQGKGCSPGAVGVSVGGDRTSGYVHAKEQLFRTLDDVNTDERLRDLEASIMSTVNALDIGPMGFGGKVTLIGCKIGALNRLPASFFVSVAYDCWAFRRLGVTLDASTGAINSWLYRDPSHPIIPMIDQAGFARTGREVALHAPLTEDAVRALKVGDVVLVSGRMFTGRDAVHSYLMKHEPPVDLRGSVLYHCGPVVVKEESGWRVTAAGPTTSIREEPYQGEIIKRYGVRAVMGKGGMGAKTLAALKARCRVLNAIGGAAQFYARSIAGRCVAARVGNTRSDVHLMVGDFRRLSPGRARQQPAQDIEQESGEHRDYRWLNSLSGGRQ